MTGHWIYAERPPTADPYPDPTDRNGKWMLFVPNAAVDQEWLKVIEALEQGKLGSSAKVATMMEDPFYGGQPTRLICVYTFDSDDIEDVQRILAELRQIGHTGRLFYKEDAATLAGQYAESGKKVNKYRAEPDRNIAERQHLADGPSPDPANSVANRR